MKILFAGTPEFAATALAAILNANYSVCAVYTQPDRPAGRGRKLQASAVKSLATAHNLLVLQPETLRDPDAQARFKEFNADLMIVAAYGLILPKAVLNLPKFGCINIHASLLPRWRGAAPIQRALLAGDTETGITIMRMVKRLDAGPMLAQFPCPIMANDTAVTLHERLAKLGAAAIIDVINALINGAITSHLQDENLATYAHKLEKSESWLDWRRSAQELERQVRAFDSYPVAQTCAGDTVIRIWNAAVIASNVNSSVLPGTILSVERNGIKVATGNGALMISKIQLAGGKPLDINSFLNSHTNLLKPEVVLTDCL